MTVSISSVTVYNGAKGFPSRNRFEASNWALLLLITPLASNKAVLPSLLLPPRLSSPCDSPEGLATRIWYYRQGSSKAMGEEISSSTYPQPPQNF